MSLHKIYKPAKKFSALAVLLLFQLFNPKIVRAETILFEDDFSNGFEKWQSVRDNFEMWSIVDQQADVFVDTASTLAELVPKDEFWNPDWKNIVYELDYKFLEGIDKNISFGFKDVKNWYEIHFVGSTYFLSHLKNGRVVWDDVGTGSPVAGQFSRVRIELNEGSIVVYIDGKKIIDVVDPTFDNDYGKIGIKAGAGTVYPTHAIYDNILVKALETGVKLAVPVFKQIDPVWADEEYDTASYWVGQSSENTGIGDWGCLISSIAMVMNYHGIDSMPDGDAINPSTLNAWLNSQEDGYLGAGLVNWLAVTRLTRLIHEQNETPNLEYLRHDGEDLGVAETEISAGNPVVLEIPGHFLVGTGVVENTEIEPGAETELGTPTSDLYITDPAYIYEKLSEHNKALVSTRTLTPSFTDLSYIHLSSTAGANIEIKNEDGTEITTLQSFEEYLESDGFLEVAGTPQTSPAMKIVEISKPNPGNYIIELSQEVFGESEINIFAYDLDGNLSNLSFTGKFGQNPIKLKLIYKNDGVSTIHEIYDFSMYLNDIKKMYQLGEIKKHYVALELKKLTTLASESSPTNYQKYKAALTQTIEWYSPHISENSQLFLLDQLTKI